MVLSQIQAPPRPEEVLDQVLPELQRRWHRELDSLRVNLRDAIADQVAQAVACTSQQQEEGLVSSSESVVNECQYILNVASGVAHEVLLTSPQVDRKLWTAFCGWKFGRSEHAKFITFAELPACYKLLCTTCLGTLRELRKNELRERECGILGVPAVDSTGRPSAPSIHRIRPALTCMD